MEIGVPTTVQSSLFNSLYKLICKSVSSEGCLNHHHAILEHIKIAIGHFPPQQCSLIKRKCLLWTVNVYGWLFCQLENVAKESNLHPVEYHMIPEDLLDAPSRRIFFQNATLFSLSSCRNLIAKPGTLIADLSTVWTSLGCNSDFEAGHTVPNSYRVRKFNKSYMSGRNVMFKEAIRSVPTVSQLYSKKWLLPNWKKSTPHSSSCSQVTDSAGHLYTEINWKLVLGLCHVWFS